jgi:putative transposase
MSHAYSLDLRLRVVASIRSGLSSYEAAERFQVSQSSAQRWFNRAEAEGSPAALPRGGSRGFLLAARHEWIKHRLAEAPDLSLRRLMAELREIGVEVSYFGVWNFVHSSGLSYKKKSARQRTRSSGCGSQTAVLEAVSKPD